MQARGLGSGLFEATCLCSKVLRYVVFQDINEKEQMKDIGWLGDTDRPDVQSGGPQDKACRIRLYFLHITVNYLKIERVLNL